MLKAAEEKRLEYFKTSYRHYYKNYSLQFTLGVIWLISAYIGKFDIQLSILSLLMGISLLKPTIAITTRFLGARKVSKDESLALFVKLFTIGMLLGMIAGFFPFLENINYFFPAFAIIIGLIFACIAYTSKLLSYGILSLVLIVGACYMGYTYDEEFNYAGYYSGITLTAFGLWNGIIGKRMHIGFRLLKRKMKLKWKQNLIEQATQQALNPKNTVKEPAIEKVS